MLFFTPFAAGFPTPWRQERRADGLHAVDISNSRHLTTTEPLQAVYYKYHQTHTPKKCRVWCLVQYLWILLEQSLLLLFNPVHTIQQIQTKTHGSMQEWRPMTTHHFLLRHAEAIATSTLPLSFSGLVLEGAANFWWAHKALATWATLIAMPSMLLCFTCHDKSCSPFEMFFLVSWGASHASGNEFKIINWRIPKCRNVGEQFSKLSSRCLWCITLRRCALLTCSAVQWPPNSTAFEITSGGEMGLGMGPQSSQSILIQIDHYWSLLIHIVDANMVFEWSVSNMASTNLVLLCTDCELACSGTLNSEVQHQVSQRSLVKHQMCCNRFKLHLMSLQVRTFLTMLTTGNRHWQVQEFSRSPSN